MFEDCDGEYVVPHISFDSFVINDFNNQYLLELKRFDSKIWIWILMPDSIRDSIRMQTADSQVPNEELV